jgi:uncharacterized membrane protein YfcA
MAYVGGSLQLPKVVFYWILFITLIFVALRIYLWNTAAFQLELRPIIKIILSLLSGGVLGFVAGTVGIGGGVYLVPLIIILNLGTEKEAAACGAVFVWVNSVSGLAARLQHNPVDLMDYIPLVIAVLIGGTVGSYLGSGKFSPQTMQKLLGLIILVAIGLLGNKLLF